MVADARHCAVGSTSIRNLEELIIAHNHYIFHGETNPLLLSKWRRDYVDARRDYLEEPYKARSVMGHV